MVVRVGELAPEHPLVRPDGSPATLATFRGEATLLVYLRHLG
ncbi:MAG: hypothetical protein QOK31_1865 [Solirubrobacteraceae bacterium]|jgi:hypothetical protein|nr:hypothetical protein [Solirubrobacteraceae bacterium]